MRPLLLAALLCRLSGAHSSAVTGPGAVTRWERDSLTVWCYYEPRWETYVKYWCRGADWSNCDMLVKTTKSMHKKGRVSIKDYQNSRMFSVTMVDLRLDDADIYWCAIERVGADHKAQVQVTVRPVITTVITTVTTPTAPVTPGESKVSPTPSNTRDPIRKILPPLIAAGLLLVLVAASLLAWGLLRRRRRAAPGIVPEQVRGPRPDRGPQPPPGAPRPKAPESELCYADLVLRPPRPSRKEAPARLPSVARMEVEVEYGNVAPPPKEDVSYAALSFGTTDQEPTYSNMEQLSARTPSWAREEASEYSTIRKP